MPGYIAECMLGFPILGCRIEPIAGQSDFVLVALEMIAYHKGWAC